MNIKNLRFAATFLIACNLLQSPAHATISTTDTTIPKDTLQTVGIAAVLYIGYNALTRTTFLVSEKFPEAQAWYNSVAEKYPQAGLENILFFQVPKSDFISDVLTDLAKKCAWTAASNHIYFKKDALTEINFLYKKHLEGYPLDEKESGKLAGHEFTLLHEAAHINNDDAQTTFLSILGLFLAQQEITKHTGDYQLLTAEQAQISPGFKVLGKSFLDFEIPASLLKLSTASFIAAVLTILRHQEANADRFAIETADVQALQNAIKKFENDEIDALYDLENASLDPYAQSDSLLQTFVQNLVSPIECGIGYCAQQAGLLIKSNSVTRQAYDFLQNPMHQSPYLRAQAIKDEIARREQN